MTYLEFNEKILTFYLSRARSPFFSLSLDKYELENDICPLGQLTGFTELKHSWNDLLQQQAGIPYYIGLLALQCLAASMMQDEKPFTAAAYRTRLKELLGLADVSEVNSLFVGKDPQSKFQDKVWAAAEQYFAVRHGLKLSIPPQSTGTWRYVRYPLSQALLKTEDLKCFIPFFSETFQPNELIHFNHFNELIQYNLLNISLKPRAQHLLKDETKNQQCLQQIYNFYNEWDGSTPATPQNKPRQRTQSEVEAKNQSKLILSLEGGSPLFYLSLNESTPFPACNLFLLRDYKYLHNGIIIFNQMEYAEAEYEDSRYLFKNVPSYLVFLGRSHFRLLSFINKEQILCEELGDDLYLFNFQEQNSALSHILSGLIQKSRPFSLFGGVKINKTKAYLLGWGPSIECTLTYSVICNHIKIDYQPSTAPTGIYKVRVDNYPDVNFKIVNRPCIEGIIPRRVTGWNLKSLTPSTEYHLQGAIVELTEDYPRNTLDHWLELNRGYTKIPSSTHQGHHGLLKFLKHSRK